MQEIILQANLALLNYTPEWLDCGLLTEELLKEQVEEFKTGDDTNTEHYRYRLLHNYLKLNEAVEDEKLDHILHILKYDDDKAMASSVIIQLLNKQLLTDGQFKKVKDLLLTFGEHMAKYVDKAEKKRLL